MSELIKSKLVEETEKTTGTYFDIAAILFSTCLISFLWMSPKSVKSIIVVMESKKFNDLNCEFVGLNQGYQPGYSEGANPPSYGWHWFDRKRFGRSNSTGGDDESLDIPSVELSTEKQC